MSVVFEYLYSLCLAAAAAGVLTLIAPLDGKAVGKVIKYPIALALMLALLTPLPGITEAVKNTDLSGVGDKLSATGSYSGDVGIALDYVVASGREAAEEKLKDMIASRFSLSREEITVTLKLTDDLRLESAEAVLGFGAFGAERADVEEYLGDICGCRVSVTYK